MAEPPGPRAPAAAGSPPACEEALRLWRTGLSEDALRLLEAEEDRDPLAAPLHYLHGLILLDRGRTEEAMAAFRCCTYADQGFVLGHLAQACLFVRLGFRDRAMTALENTVRLVAGLQPDDLVLEGDGPTVRDVLDLASTQRELLEPGHLPEVRYG